MSSSAFGLEILDIRSIRQAKGMTLKSFASLFQVKEQELKKLERGFKIPNTKLVKDIANYFSVDYKLIKIAQEELYKNQTTGEGYVTSQSTSNQIIPRRKEPTDSKVPILDIFCGIGGFSHGFELTGRFQVVAGVDLLQDRVETFYLNHDYAHAYCYDIYDLKPELLLQNIPKPKIIIGGSPCQGFSSIRPFRSININDKRNTLFEQFAYYVSILTPDWFVLENVVGLLTHKNGQTLNLVVSAFEAIGYKVNYKVLNGALYGLPQNRERLFIVGNNKKIDFAFPEPTHYYNFQSMAKGNGVKNNGDLFSQELPIALTIMDAIHDLPKLESGESSTTYPQNISLTDYERRMRGNETLLTLHTSTLHSKEMMEIIRQSGSNINSVAHLVTSGFSTSYSRLEADRPSVTITVNFVHPSSNKCIHPYQNRALTPREGARLQSFEDNFKFYGTKSQIVKQIGNAVPPLLGKVIADAILEHGY
ncbi:MAG: DNA (cytosine-5-)-methyltransferase [Sphingobacteriales bacterium]|nr:MAG: DNA (cytosine-5-)-methyltransferase [Sphingobacteriales bacterium]